MLSIENAAVERLHARIQQSPLAQVRQQLIHHLEETREQKERLISLIAKLGGQPTDERAQLPSYSPPKSLADILNSSSTTPEEQELKTLEVDALIEHAEIIGYNTLIQMASKLSIGEAIPPLRQSLQEEDQMAAWARANLPSNFIQLWMKNWY
jgi:ferritin-like metal-binding protein YciE